MNNKELLSHILKNRRWVTTYYPYPTGGYGTENIIVSTDNFNGNTYDEPLRNMVALTIKLGAIGAGCSTDNKTAVKVEVEGLDFPVYFIQYDGKYYLSKEVHCKSEEISLKERIGIFL